MSKPLSLSFLTLFLISGCRAQAPINAHETVLAADRDLSTASFTKGPMPSLSAALEKVDGTLAWPGGPGAGGVEAAADHFLRTRSR